MEFLSHMKYGSNLVEMPTTLNYYFLCLSSTPKDSTNSIPMTYPGSNSCLQPGQGRQYWDVDRLPVDIRASSKSPWWKKGGGLGHSIY